MPVYLKQIRSHRFTVKTLIDRFLQLRMEMGEMSKRQQPDHAGISWNVTHNLNSSFQQIIVLFIWYYDFLSDFEQTNDPIEIISVDIYFKNITYRSRVTTIFQFFFKCTRHVCKSTFLSKPVIYLFLTINSLISKSFNFIILFEKFLKRTFGDILVKSQAKTLCNIFNQPILVTIYIF